MSAPLISCIYITRKRPHLLQNAIDCYKRQLFKSKALIILFEHDNEATAAFLDSAPGAGDSQIKAIEVARHLHQCY